MNSILLALAAMLCWGISDATLKALTNKFDALTSAVYKFVPHLFFLGIVFFIAGPVVPADLSTWALIAGFGLIGAIALYTFVSSIDSGAVSIAVAVAHTNAIITAVLSAIFLSEILTGFSYMAIFGIIAGVFLITVDLGTLRFRKIRGIGNAAITAVGWGIIYVLLKVIVERIGPYSAAFYCDAVVVLLIVLLFLAKRTVAKKVSSRDIILIIGSALASAGAATFTAISLSLGFVSITLGIISAAPFVTLVIAYLFLKERISLQQVFGILTITVGLVVLSVFG